MSRGLYSLMRVLAFAAVGGLLVTLCPCGHAAAEPASPRPEAAPADHACCLGQTPATPAAPQPTPDSHDCPHCEAASPSACGELETATVPGPAAPDLLPAAAMLPPIFQQASADLASPALSPTSTDPVPRSAGTLCALHSLLLI